MLRYLKFLFVAAAATQNNVPANQKCTVPTKEEFTETLVKEYCTMSGVYADNKPNTFPMGMLNGKNRPLSCLEGKKDTCVKQVKEWNNFIHGKKRMQKKIELDALRDKCDKKLTSYTNAAQAKLNVVFQNFQLKLSPAQKAAIDAFLEKLLIFRSMHISGQLMKEQMLGNCGEQSDYVAINLLRHAQKNGLKLDIKLVSASFNATPGNFVNDHAFILLNSDAPVVNIVNDPAKTKAYLEALKQSPNSGKICDSWQSRKKMFLFSQDSSNLYDHHAGWTSINVQELKLDLAEYFKNTNVYPLPLQKFFCEELASMELSENVNGTCEQVEKNYKKMMNRR